jgi:hypothetical protein
MEGATAVAYTVRSIYRRMLKLAYRLPVSDRASAVQQIRIAFRENAAERRNERILELLTSANKKLDYLKVVTPREFGDDVGAGMNRFYLRGGQLVVAESTGSSSTFGSAELRPCNDPDILARHERGMRRFRFQDRK